MNNLFCSCILFLLIPTLLSLPKMIRDDKMVQLVAAEKEPITPFVKLVRSLYQEIGLSSILVIGGSGDFFDVADNVIVMDCYKCNDATERAKQIASQSAATKPAPEENQHRYQPGIFQKIRSGGRRFLVGDAFHASGKVRVNSPIVFSYGETEVNLAGLEQLVSKAQTNAIAAALQKVASVANGNLSVEQVLNQIEQALESQTLSDVMAPGQFNGALARPRRLELAGAINRLRRTGSIVQR